MIGQGNMGFPVFCDFESEQNYVITYLHPHHLNDIQDVIALFDVNTEVVIRHILTTGVQRVAKITQLNSFSHVPLSVQINSHQNYTGLYTQGMDPYVYLGMVPNSLLYKGVTHGWTVENNEQSYKNCDSTFSSYFAVQTNENGASARLINRCGRFSSRPIMNAWKHWYVYQIVL